MKTLLLSLLVLTNLYAYYPVGLEQLELPEVPSMVDSQEAESLIDGSKEQFEQFKQELDELCRQQIQSESVVYQERKKELIQQLIACQSQECLANTKKAIARVSSSIGDVFATYKDAKQEIVDRLDLQLRRYIHNSLLSHVRYVVFHDTPENIMMLKHQPQISECGLTKTTEVSKNDHFGTIFRSTLCVQFIANQDWLYTSQISLHQLSHNSTSPFINRINIERLFEYMTNRKQGEVVMSDGIILDARFEKVEQL